MLRKRIIFTLIYNDGFFMQSRNFRLQKVGNIQWLEKNYKFQNIAFSLDELIVLNASRGDKTMHEFAATVSKLTTDVFIPVAAGGGIRKTEDAELLFKNGADKIVLNSVLYTDPLLVKKLVQRYGSQSIIASIDYKREETGITVFINNGITAIDLPLGEYLKYVESLNIGEIYLNSIDRDGTGFGYNLGTIKEIEQYINVPLIIAGGAGNESHLMEGLAIEGVNAVATANLFNFMGDGLPLARKRIIDSGKNLAVWDS